MLVLTFEKESQNANYHCLHEPLLYLISHFISLADTLYAHTASFIYTCKGPFTHVIFGNVPLFYVFFVLPKFIIKIASVN